MKRSGAGAVVLIGVVWLSLSGCEVGPSFKSPAAPSETSYVPPAMPQTFAPGAEVTANWWTLFRCGELDALVKQAVAGSWSLEAARGRMAQAQQAVSAAASALSLQLALSVSAAHERLTAASFGLPASALALPPNFNLLQVGPVASYSLDIFGGTRRRIEQAQALASFQSDELRAAYLTLTGNTVLQAVQLAMLVAQQQALERIVELDRRNLDLIQTANRIGSIAASDVVLAQTQLAEDQALLPPLEQSRASATHALAILLGRAPDEWQPPSIDLGALKLPLPIPVRLPSQLVHQRPDILAAEAQLHAASAQIGIATAALYPDISLTAFINGSSLNGGNLFNPANLAWSIAAGLTQPLFDANLRRSEQREALAAYRASAADYQQTVLEAFQQVADLLQALGHDTERLDAEKAALDSASRSIQLQRAALAGGGSGILGLLDAQRQFGRASLQFLQAQAQRYEDAAQLFVAMGGGWWQGQ